MKLTVAICTWNRAPLLDMTLTEMHKLQVPAGVDWEALIVDNNCTDNTKEVIADHLRYLPARGIFEPKLGLSNARNAAVSAALGDYILWTDDDVLVDPGWLHGYVRAIRNWPEAAVFGGPITPWFEGDPPKWLQAVWQKVANAYAVRDLGPVPLALSQERLPFGANYAVSVPQHRRYRYDAGLGRSGKGMMGYEESALITAMLKDGFKGVWTPEPKVRHFIPRARQKAKYLRRYFHGQGLYLAQTSEPLEAVKWFGRPRWLIRRAVQTEMSYWLRRLFSPPVVWIDDLIRASSLWGQLQGMAALREERLEKMNVEL